MLRRSSGREVPASTPRSDRRRPSSGQALRRASLRDASRISARKNRASGTRLAEGPGASGSRRVRLQAPGSGLQGRERLDHREGDATSAWSLLSVRSFVRPKPCVRDHDRRTDRKRPRGRWEPRSETAIGRRNGTAREPLKGRTQNSDPGALPRPSLRGPSSSSFVTRRCRDDAPLGRSSRASPDPTSGSSAPFGKRARRAAAGPDLVRRREREGHARTREKPSLSRRQCRQQSLEPLAVHPPWSLEPGAWSLLRYGSR